MIIIYTIKKDVRISNGMRAYNNKTGELVGSISQVVGSASFVIVTDTENNDESYDYHGYKFGYSHPFYCDEYMELSKITSLNKALETKVNFKW